MASVFKKLFKGSVIRLIALLANIAVGFFMMPFLVHSLGDNQYGLWVIVGAIIGFYGLLDLGMGRAIVRFIVRALHDHRNDEVNATLSTAVFLFGGIGLLSLFVTLAVILLLPVFMGEGINTSLMQLMIGVMGLNVAIQFPLSSFSGVLLAKYRFDISSYIQLFSLVLRSGLIVIFVSQGYSIIAVSVITALDAIFASMLTIYVAKQLLPGLTISRSRVSIERLKKLYNFGKYVYIIAIADRVRFSIDDLVVGAMISIGSVTHYTIAVTLTLYFGQVMAAIFGVIAPLLHKYHKLGQWEELRSVFLVATELTSMTSVLIGGLLIVLGEPFIHMWMGEDYGDSYMVLVILSIAGMAANAQRPSVNVLFAIAQHKFYAKITSMEAVVNIFLSIVLAQHLGIYGVALGTAIPLLVNKLVLQPMYTCKQLDVSLKDYYWRLSKFAFLGFVMFSPIIIIDDVLVFGSFLDLMVVGGFMSMVYIIASTRLLMSETSVEYLLKVVPKGMRFLLKS